MTWQEAQWEMKKSLSSIYDDREASQITEWAMEFISQTPRIDRIMRANDAMTTDEIALWHQYNKELQEGKPIQYVIGYAWFLGNRFYVNQHVLIPRPETGELVEIIYNENKDRTNISIIDIGTGSGCIPISLKLMMSSAKITALDVSMEALKIAQANAALHHTDIHFMQEDIFDHEKWKQLPAFDIIVSNPPYIPYSEKNSLHENVRNHEPHLALFVSNDDPLSFYKTIAALGIQKLKQNGLLYFETHYLYANEVATLLMEYGFEVTVLKDFFGKDRFVKSCLKRTQ